ncbi:MAG TPA: hypothetical protein VE423_09345 [Microvirga sp.]|jgi:MYXO-CTERM domain-containing protein|nr:hypothetical protein [Microvirga sp.]
MLANFKASVLTMILMVWSTFVVAQTTPGGGTTSPSGTTTSTDPAAAAGDGMDWIWIIVALAVVAGLLYYFLGRRRTDTRI